MNSNILRLVDEAIQLEECLNDTLRWEAEAIEADIRRQENDELKEEYDFII